MTPDRPIVVGPGPSCGHLGLDWRGGLPPGAGPAPVMRWKQEPIAIYVDFEFTFEVVAGKGIVRTR